MSSVRVVAIVLLVFVSGLQAQTKAGIVRPLSLRDCIGWALDRNLRVLIARDSADIARFTLQASQGLYDPVFSLSGRDVFVDVPAQFDAKKIGISVEYEEQLVSFGPGLSGRLPFGFTYALSSISTYEHAHSVFSTNFFDPTAQIFIDVPGGIRNSNAWFNVTGVSVAQPLLKDFWIDIYRRDVELNRKRLQISRLAFQQAVIDAIALVETEYYNVLLAREEVKVQKKSFATANQLLTEIRRQVEVGTLADLDAKQAESAVETARSQVAGAEGRYAVQKNNLKNLLTDNLQEWSGVEIDPTDQLTVANEPARLQESWSNAMNNRTELLIARLLSESADINLRYFYNQLFPALNLTGTYGWYTFNHSFSGHLDDLKQGANAYYSAGVLFLSATSRRVILIRAARLQKNKRCWKVPESSSRSSLKCRMP
jgi:hypothetical protein